MFTGNEFRMSIVILDEGFGNQIIGHMSLSEQFEV